MENFGKKSNIGHPDGHLDDSHPDYLTDHPFKIIGCGYPNSIQTEDLSGLNRFRIRSLVLSFYMR